MSVIVDFFKIIELMRILYCTFVRRIDIMSHCFAKTFENNRMRDSVAVCSASILFGRVSICCSCRLLILSVLLVKLDWLAVTSAGCTRGDGCSRSCPIRSYTHETRASCRTGAGTRSCWSDAEDGARLPVRMFSACVCVHVFVGCCLALHTGFLSHDAFNISQ